jgi:para-aminobenzoate synthetase/4-amino-4-deoxychorismate lyase
MSSPGIWRIVLAAGAVDSRDVFLFHKTTCRGVYDAARAAFPGADDVILWNERGELTESCFANVVLALGGELVTPPVECGLLAGTFRAELLAAGVIRERVLRREDLARADAVWLVNSVRGWIRAEVNPQITQIAQNY